MRTYWKVASVLQFSCNGCHETIRIDFQTPPTWPGSKKAFPSLTCNAIYCKQFQLYEAVWALGSETNQIPPNVFRFLRYIYKYKYLYIQSFINVTEDGAIGKATYPNQLQSEFKYIQNGRCIYFIRIVIYNDIFTIWLRKPVCAYLSWVLGVLSTTETSLVWNKF